MVTEEKIVTTLIGLIADIHASAGPLEEALEIFCDEGVKMVLCIGDVAGYGTETEQVVVMLKEKGCTVLQGNHEAWYLDKVVGEQESSLSEYFSDLPVKWESIIEGIRVYAVHASPPDSLNRGIRLLDEKGDIVASEKKRWTDELASYPFDVLIVGHTHQVFAEQAGDKLVINPGSTIFNHTCAILSLPDKNVRIIPLSGEKPLLSWNWGMIAGNGSIVSTE